MNDAVKSMTRRLKRVEHPTEANTKPAFGKSRQKIIRIRFGRTEEPAAPQTKLQHERENDRAAAHDHGAARGYSKDKRAGLPTSAAGVSFVVPVYNNASDLPDCIGGLRASDPDCEIIVVDDASTDNSDKVAAHMGARVLRLGKNSGPAAARNYGVRHAKGDIVFFVDSDVVIAPDAVRRVLQVFETDPAIAAVFGSYDSRPRHKGLISQYRNLLHHFVHQNGKTDASSFWAGCGAIRRSVFEELGGFDQDRFPRPSIEDIELGQRLRQAGYRIVLDKQLQGTHLKGWKFFAMLRTDILCRAIPWSRLILESKNRPNDLNLKLGQRVSVFLAALACAFVLGSLVRPSLLAGAAAALLGVAVINKRLYAFFGRQRGAGFALVCFGLHVIYYLYSGLSYLSVWLEYRFRQVAGFALVYGRNRLK